MKDLEFTITRTLKEGEIKDILTTAIEGGIGYFSILDNDTPEWKAASKACRARMHDTPCYCDVAYELISTGKSVRFIDAESEDTDEPGSDEVWYLTWENFTQGCILWEKWSGRNLAKAVKEGDFDAEDADVLIQYALFGDIIYG